MGVNIVRDTLDILRSKSLAQRSCTSEPYFTSVDISSAWKCWYLPNNPAFSNSWSCIGIIATKESISTQALRTVCALCVLLASACCMHCQKDHPNLRSRHICEFKLCSIQTPPLLMIFPHLFLLFLLLLLIRRRPTAGISSAVSK